MAITEIILTSGTTWAVPVDFDPNNNTVECIEGGENGGGGSNGLVVGKTSTGGNGGDSGQGGRFEGITNFQVSYGMTCTINIGAANAAKTVNNPTWISKTGSIPTTAADGCLAKTGASVGNYGYDGGPTVVGGNNSGSTGGSGKAGGGAGGNAGAASGATPGAMSPAWSGASPGTGGTAGGTGGNATNYGAGGGSGKGGNGPSSPGSAGGAGKQGVIVIRYTPYVPPASTVTFRASIIG